MVQQSTIISIATIVSNSSEYFSVTKFLQNQKNNNDKFRHSKKS